MKIIQVATLVTPDGAYGGPIRVAINQTRALRDAGHEVEFVAGASGFGRTLPSHFDGVRVKLFPVKKIPKLGFSGMLSWSMRKWLRANLPAADVAHIHMGRDLISLPAALAARQLGLPYVLQTHGMVTPSAHPLAGIVDRKWTIPALAGARRVLFLTEEERTGLNKVAPLEPILDHLHNGVPESDAAPSESLQGLEVLFLARLHERKRPLMFVEMAKELSPMFPNVQFVLAGPDGGEGEAIREAILSSGISDNLCWEGAIAPDKTAIRLSACDVYVLPSINEPFPMSVLEALASGKPCVVTDSCGLSKAISEGQAGHVVNASLSSLVAAVRRLLEDGEHRQLMGANAKSLSKSSFGMSQVATRLEDVYREAGANV